MKLPKTRHKKAQGRIKTILPIPQNLFSCIQTPCHISVTRTDTYGQNSLDRFESIHLNVIHENGDALDEY